MSVTGRAQEEARAQAARARDNLGVPVHAPDFSEVRTLIRDHMARDSVPGFAIAVSRGDSILWEEGFGWADREARIPATAQTPFYLASVTKTITATAVMMLRERGALDLDRPANDYLGAAQLWSPAWDPNGATVRRLATHTSGLTTFDLSCAADRPQCRVPPLDEIIRHYGVLVWPPGEQFDYSNLGYHVLSEVVAHAARRDVSTFVRDELFRPLGMTHASFGVDSALERETAVRYHWTRGPLPRRTSTASPPGYASAHDLVLFGMMHAKARRPGSHAVLSDASIDTMQYATVPTGGGSVYGLGWWIEDRFGYRTVLAQGGTDAAQAWLRVLPSERVAVVVLANKGVGFTSDVVDAAISALLVRYAERRAAPQAQPASDGNAQTAPASTPLGAAFVGTWQGVVRTEEGNVSLEVAFSDSGTARGTIGARADAWAGRATFEDPLFRLKIPGDLETPDSTGGRQLSFYLRKRDGVLNGTVTTRPRAASGLDGRVSYWVELRKRS